MTQYKYERKMMNYLLQPFLQLKIGLYTAFLSVFFCTFMGWFLYKKLNSFTDVAVTLTEADDEIYMMLSSYMSTVATTAIILGSAFIVLNLLISIYYTHKMVGPTIAFRRHIKQLKNGNYDSRVVIRNGDAFSEVADELNQLTEVLAGKYSR